MSFSKGISISGGNLEDEEIRKKIRYFFDKYYNQYRKIASETNIGLANFNLGKPNNFYFAVDRIRTYIVFSSDFADGIKEIIDVDLRDQKGDDFSIFSRCAYFLNTAKCSVASV